jgi:uncharacterized protein YqiB (DUF1249 family)
MARFNLEDYATVEERLKTFWASEDSKDARIVTVNHTTDPKLWIIEARLYLSAGDQAADLPKTTGWANELAADAFGLERCETSAIGRCLANYIYSGNKRSSREEMTKVLAQDWLERAATLETIEELRDLYTQARANNAPAEVLERLKGYADRFAESQNPRTPRGVSDSSTQGKKSRG